MFFFAIQNLVDIQSSRFWLYSQKANYKWRSYQADRPLVIQQMRNPTEHFLELWADKQKVEFICYMVNLRILHVCRAVTIFIS